MRTGKSFSRTFLLVSAQIKKLVINQGSFNVLSFVRKLATELSEFLVKNTATSVTAELSANLV
jgi:hypothetical protein